jgi:hypothetical protein
MTMGCGANLPHVDRNDMRAARDSSCSRNPASRKPSTTLFKEPGRRRIGWPALTAAIEASACTDRTSRAACGCALPRVEFPPRG